MIHTPAVVFLYTCSCIFTRFKGVQENAKLSYSSLVTFSVSMSGDLAGLGGRSPQNLRWGRPMHPSTQNFEKYCYRMRVKVVCELIKKGVMKEFFILK